MWMGSTMCNKIETIGSLLTCGYEKLKNAGIDSYQIDSQILLSKAMDKDRIFILTNRDMPVGEKASEEYLRLVDLREKKMPVKYILGECEFMGYMFKVVEGVLIPRPDTEVLVENVIALVKERGYRKICDVCTGSGIIGITVAKECEETEVLCLDISSAAIETAMENAKDLGVSERVEVVFSDLLEYALDREIRFDAIISNPPYIRTSDIESLMVDVKDYEPFEALCGGEDGLEFYRKITEQSMRLLCKDGMLAFEIGYDQRADVMDILAEKGFRDIASAKDLSGNDRVVLGFRN
jgi:release factor glutamine methyltransferase